MTAKWNGTAWSALSSGVNDNVRALATDSNGNLYAGGYFTDAGGGAANHVAKWNGSAWSPLGSGTGDTVLALALDGRGNLYAAGTFTAAGGGAAANVAKWNGSTWAALGTGLAGGVVFSYARTLSLDGQGNLYAGGGYTTAGGVTVNNVARWNGASWAALGTGTNGTVYAAQAAGGGCYVGGTFTAVGDNSQLMTRVGYFAATVTATGRAQAPLPLEIFPNPAHTAVAVQLPGGPRAGTATLTLVDALGRTVRTLPLPLPATATTVTVPLAGLVPGRYLLRVQTAGQEATRALVVE